MNNIVRGRTATCASCGAEREHWGDAPEGWQCWECQTAEREQRARSEEQYRAEQQASHRQEVAQWARENPEDALALCGTPVRYRWMTRQTWESEFSEWPREVLPRDGSPSWFLSELAAWPQGWTAHGGWSDRRCLTDWLVVLHGLYGRRKTGLATATLHNAFVEARLAPEDALWIDTCRLIRAMTADSFAKEGAWFRRVSEVPMLLLDDFAAVYGGRLRDVDRAAPAGWWQGVLAELMRYREMECLPTLFTMNNTIASLAMVDPSLVSRLDVRLQWQCTGPDVRQRAHHGNLTQRRG